MAFYAKDFNIISIVIHVCTNPLWCHCSVISKIFYMGDIHRILRQTCDKFFYTIGQLDTSSLTLTQWSSTNQELCESLQAFGSLKYYACLSISFPAYLKAFSKPSTLPGSCSFSTLIQLLIWNKLSSSCKGKIQNYSKSLFQFHSISSQKFISHFNFIIFNLKFLNWESDIFYRSTYNKMNYALNIIFMS